VVVGVAAVHGEETLIVASRERRVLLCAVDEVNYLSGPGRGVQLLKLRSGDRLLGFRAALSDRDTLTVRTSLGGEQRINTAKYERTGRGGKGREIIKRGQLLEVVPDPPQAPSLEGGEA
jgi:DNA gyrase/topoisomerase IV subunit A